MLEIFLIIGLSKHLGQKAFDKGHHRGYGALGGGLWVVGEILGFVVGIAAGASELGLYGFALAGAALGAAMAYTIISLLPNHQRTSADSGDADELREIFR